MLDDDEEKIVTLAPEELVNEVGRKLKTYIYLHYKE
jgi:hypothetical protein